MDQELLEILRQMQNNLGALKGELLNTKHEILQSVDKKIKESQVEMLSGVKVLLENDVQSQINLVAEDVQIIRDRMPDSGDIADLQDQISTLKTVVKLHSEDIKSLKKAQ